MTEPRCRFEWDHSLNYSALLQQSPRNDLRLDLAGALKDTEDAGVAEQATDWILEGKSVPAMNLQGTVGGGPGYAGRRQFRHAGFQVAARSCVLGACREVRQLTRAQHFRRHHQQFVVHARVFKQSPSELTTF